MPTDQKKSIRRRSERPPREADEVLRDAQRFVRAMGRRVEYPEHLALLRLGVRKALDEAEALGVDQLRANGYSNQEIGMALGVTRWAVLRRWPRVSR